jgi:hypothetical protein
MASLADSRVPLLMLSTSLRFFCLDCRRSFRIGYAGNNPVSLPPTVVKHTASLLPIFAQKNCMHPLTGIYGIIGLIIIFACKKNSIDANTPAGVSNLVEDETWRITEFVEDGRNETSHFSDYYFAFDEDDKLVATNGTTIHEGTWTVNDRNSLDDDLNELNFSISFSSPTTFEDLSDDWNILEKNSHMIRLADIRSGGGGKDYLEFRRE